MALFGTAKEAGPTHSDMPDPPQAIIALPAPAPAELAGSETMLRTPVHRNFSSQQIPLAQSSPHRGAPAPHFTQSRDRLVSPILQSPLLSAYFSPNAQSGSEQPFSSDEEAGLQGEFSPYQISHPQTPINRGHRKITLSYSQDPAPWCVNPWMAPPMPFPPQWQYWAPWASYP